MIPARTFRMGALVAALSLGIAALGHEIFYLPWLRPMLAKGEGSLQDTSAEALNRGIRAALPVGSSRSAVEALLPTRQIPYDFVSPQQIEAVARDLKGSSPSGHTALSLRFDFDDHDRLLSIHSQVIRTPKGK